jgi:acyl-CoA synthetase (NDP forming)
LRTDFKAFFNPRSIAIVGASPNEVSINGRTLKYLLKHNYTGKIFPVNPKYNEIRGIPTFPDIASIPGQIDLAILIVAAKGIPDVIDQCMIKNVPFAIIYSSGFAESGDEGERLQHYLSDVTKSGKIRILGPNCQGMFNVAGNVAASFSGGLESPNIQTGPISFASQSGALGFSTFTMLQEAGIGFNYVVSTGNEADLEVIDFLQEFATDDQTKVLVSYVEGFKKPERLYDLAEASLKSEKPVLIFKVGSSEIGAKAASSHTAALSGSGALYDCMFSQLGLTKVSDIEEISDLCKMLTMTKKPQGKRIGIVTTSGGAGVILADQCAHYGLEVPALAEETKHTLRQYLPDFGSDLNPVDLTAQIAGSPQMFDESVNAVATDPNIDVLVIALTMVTGPRAADMAEFLIKKSKEIDKPLLVIWLASDSLAKPGLDLLKAQKVAFFKSPKRCMKALKKYVDITSTMDQREEILEFIYNKRKMKDSQITVPGSLYEYKAKQWLNQLGLPVTKEGMAKTAEEAVSLAEKIGFPVALKVQSNQILHKTEVGGVKLNLCTKEDVTEAFKYITKEVIDKTGIIDIDGILVQEMVDEGQELFLGCTVDPQLGPSIVFGLGGIFVEALKDTQMAIPPLTKEQALKMVQSIRSFPILTGIRGKKGVDLDQLSKFISEFSVICAKLNQNVQIDLNPVVVSANGIKIVDALVISDEKVPVN